MYADLSDDFPPDSVFVVTSVMIGAAVVNDFGKDSKMAFSGSFVIPTGGGNDVSGAILVISLVSASISDDGIRVDDTDCVDAGWLIVVVALTRSESDCVELESSNPVLSTTEAG